MTRAQWLRIHRIVGLSMAAFLLVQALTGAMLLYRGPLARLIDPSGMTSTGAGRAISIGAVVETADKALPGYHAIRIFAPQTVDATWLAQLADQQGHSAYASIDPSGGALRRAGGLLHFPIEAALQIHYRLVAGKTGMVIITLNALAVLFMLVSGLAYWWPKRNLAKALSIRFTASPRLILRQAHRTLGVVMAAFLAIIASTGLLLIVPELFESGTPAPRRILPTAAIDNGMALAQATFPASTLSDARLGGDRMIVNFRAPERNARAVHRVIVDIANARIVSAIPAEKNPALWMTVLPIHTGNVLGLIGGPLLLIIALALATLALSGPIMWWHVRSQRRRPVPKVSQT